MNCLLFIIASAAIKKRTGIAKKAFTELAHVLKSKKISLKTKTFFKYYVWSTQRMGYGCERWTISRVMQENLKEAEIWLHSCVQSNETTSGPLKPSIIDMYEICGIWNFHTFRSQKRLLKCDSFVRATVSSRHA